jgi:flagellar biosynthesis protein FlhF
MQVKKFEAKSMKEALELVKIHLGPEAIILSAKDTHKGFGLMGEKSVEVTAAVTDETLRKKRIAESKLREDLREKFQQIPATKQKEFINRVFQNRVEERREMAFADGPTADRRNQGPVTPLAPEVREQLKGLRYADIIDEESTDARSRGRERVKRAAEMARKASADVLQDPPVRVTRTRPAAPVPAPQAPSREVAALETQLRELKAIVEKFQHMPQIPMTMHPGAEQGLPYEFSGLYQKLTAQGIQASTVTRLLKQAQKEMDPEHTKKPALVDAWAVRHLLHMVEVSPNPLQGRYHVFMGSTGQGKTSSLVKFASQLVLKERHTIAIISLDTMKLGAAEQLRIFAQILNVPFAIVRTPEEWHVAEQKLKKVQHILVDCPGFSLKSMEEADWLKRMLPPPQYNRTLHYVQSAVARDEETMDIAGRYQMIGFHDAIFTRLDECTRHGLLVNFQEQFGTPIHSFGTGSRIPEDFEIASKERIVDFIFKLTRQMGKEVKP